MELEKHERKGRAALEEKQMVRCVEKCLLSCFMVGLLFIFYFLFLI